VPNILDWVARRQSKRHNTAEKFTNINKSVARTESIVREHKKEANVSLLSLDRVLFPESLPVRRRVKV
jgi:hypothetical protein